MNAENWTQGDLDNRNNHSIVVRVDFGDASFLFTGDLEEAGIETLLDYYGYYEDEASADIFETDDPTATTGIERIANRCLKRSHACEDRICTGFGSSHFRSPASSRSRASFLQRIDCRQSKKRYSASLNFTNSVFGASG